MQAVVHEEYGPPEVLELGEVEVPTPQDDEVLVQVYAAAVNYGDWAFLRGKPFAVRLISGALRKPKHAILGAASHSSRAPLLAAATDASGNQGCACVLQVVG
jgi:NADPH:quinone reductase-like Zn-dependent oxidoreductase